MDLQKVTFDRDTVVEQLRQGNFELIQGLHAVIYPSIVNWLEQMSPLMSRPANERESWAQFIAADAMLQVYSKITSLQSAFEVIHYAFQHALEGCRTRCTVELSYPHPFAAKIVEPRMFYKMLLLTTRQQVKEYVTIVSHLKYKFMTALMDETMTLIPKGDPDLICFDLVKNHFFGEAILSLEDQENKITASMYRYNYFGARAWRWEEGILRMFNLNILEALCLLSNADPVDYKLSSALVQEAFFEFGDEVAHLQNLFGQTEPYNQTLICYELDAPGCNKTTMTFLALSHLRNYLQQTYHIDVKLKTVERQGRCLIHNSQPSHYQSGNIYEPLIEDLIAAEAARADGIPVVNLTGYNGNVNIDPKYLNSPELVERLQEIGLCIENRAIKYQIIEFVPLYMQGKQSKTLSHAKEGV